MTRGAPGLAAGRPAPHVTGREAAAGRSPATAPSPPTAPFAAVSMPATVDVPTAAPAHDAAATLAPVSGNVPAIAPAALPDTRPRWARAMLRVPILWKLVISDLAINVATFVLMKEAPQQWAAEIMVVALLVTLALNTALVYWALLPLRVLETTAGRVSAGDLDARVPWSATADRDVERIAATLNRLLDGVTADRVRMRHLASQVISAGDQERAHIARELHDTTAQQLAALEMLVTATLRDVHDAKLTERLHVMHEVVTESLRDVRTLSHNVHPRVLDDLGLVAALEFLARRTREQSGTAVRVTSDVRGTVPAEVASVLYRVAQEAVRNAVRHAASSAVHLRIASDGHRATLEVGDQGRGFDVAAAEASRSGMGLFVMRERLALVHGRLEIDSRPGGAGTTIRAIAPTDAPVDEPARRPA